MEHKCLLTSVLSDGYLPAPSPNICSKHTFLPLCDQDLSPTYSNAGENECISDIADSPDIVSAPAKRMKMTNKSVKGKNGEKCEG